MRQTSSLICLLQMSTFQAKLWRAIKIFINAQADVQTDFPVILWHVDTAAPMQELFYVSVSDRKFSYTIS